MVPVYYTMEYVPTATEIHQLLLLRYLLYTLLRSISRKRGSFLFLFTDHLPYEEGAYPEEGKKEKKDGALPNLPMPDPYPVLPVCMYCTYIHT